MSDTQSSYFDLISSVASWYIFPGIDGGFHSPEFIFTSIVPLIHAVPEENGGAIDQGEKKIFH